ncbi:MAG: glucose-1-phosphate adenylyltransferase subunit GlgD [Clostridia bacterium]|nr:glucose-1-phosphate adenylyltransferase subunit GlgD [Clostridia bacterium]
MRTSAVAGIVFTNVHDETMEQLTEFRSMAAVPFGARYRLIDFPLSNLINAGVYNVGLIIKEKYRSLMDHVGSGIYWDLDRKNGGLHLMPPYNTRSARRYNSYIEALYGAIDFVERCNAEYIVTYSAGIVANVNLAKAIESHTKSDADITVVCHRRPGLADRSIGLNIDADGRVTDVFAENDLSTLGIMIFKREVLLRLVRQAYQNDATDISPKDVAAMIKKLRVFGFCHEGYAAIMHGKESFYEANMDLLDANVRHDLFCKDRPILTKTRDDMPTRFGTESVVKNAFIADGCVIEGTVRNSVLFRGVKVAKGAVVENSILMQGTEVKAQAEIDHVVSDKNAVIGEKMVLKGNDQKTLMIGKKQTL